MLESVEMLLFFIRIRHFLSYALVRYSGEKNHLVKRVREASASNLLDSV